MFLSSNSLDDLRPGGHLYSLVCVLSTRLGIRFFLLLTSMATNILTRFNVTWAVGLNGTMLEPLLCICYRPKLALMDLAHFSHIDCPQHSGPLVASRLGIVRVLPLSKDIS